MTRYIGTIDTADGSTVELTRVGLEWDLHVRSATGHTISTVRMNDRAVRELVAKAGARR